MLDACPNFFFFFFFAKLGENEQNKEMSFLVGGRVKPSEAEWNEGQRTDSIQSYC
jgi:hypothetical protein